MVGVGGIGALGIVIALILWVFKQKSAGIIGWIGLTLFAGGFTALLTATGKDWKAAAPGLVLSMALVSAAALWVVLKRIRKADLSPWGTVIYGYVGAIALSYAVALGGLALATAEHWIK